MSYLLISGAIQEVEFSWMPHYIDGLYGEFCKLAGPLESFPLAEEFQFEPPKWLVGTVSDAAQITDGNTAKFAFFSDSWFETIDSTEIPEDFAITSPIAIQSQKFLKDHQVLFSNTALEHICDSEIFNVQTREVSRGIISICIPMDMLSFSPEEAEANFDGTLESIGIANFRDSRIAYWESEEGYDDNGDYVDFVGCGLAIWCNSKTDEEIAWSPESIQTLTKFIAEHTWDEEAIEYFNVALEELPREQEDGSSLEETLENLEDVITG